MKLTHQVLGPEGGVLERLVGHVDVGAVVPRQVLLRLLRGVRVKDMVSGQRRKCARVVEDG